ncbi:hypothetical protein NP493_2364g00001 [Ridgeia piscesae]|uniref:Uncharacterized protein n=1 Tax=Ridgeia piscesae TaxID=27915 RepID=A0AAD9N2I5_RIDPI|nr:hypothetical protein NP493_2364g00001 [Ridgeia piscesae]
MYLWLNDMYGLTNLSTFDYTARGIGNVSMRDVYLSNKHLKEDMIISCSWKGKLCTHEGFNLSITDAGICYTFNDVLTNDSFVRSTGRCNVNQ